MYLYIDKRIRFDIWNNFDLEWGGSRVLRLRISLEFTGGLFLVNISYKLYNLLNIPLSLIIRGGEDSSFILNLYEAWLEFVQSSYFLNT